MVDRDLRARWDNTGEAALFNGDIIYLNALMRSRAWRR